MSDRWESLFLIVWPLVVAVVIGAVVHRVLVGYARMAARSGTGRRWASVVRVVALPASIGLPLLFLSAAISASTLPADWVPPIRRALAVGGGICLTWLAVRVIGAVERRILRRYPVDVADNLAARRVHTRTRVLGRIAQTATVLVGASIILMTFPSIRQVGATLLASAGVVGLVAGIAARPVFGNLIAGLQIALTQPIRLDDVVIVQGQWGRVEELASSFVVVRTWDERRLVVPLQWFIENPFENWTRQSSALLGPVLLWLDYRTPMDAVRAELKRLCETDARWDGRVCVAQVTNSDRQAIEVRLLVSARNAGDLFDLQCAVRERMVDFLLAHHPEALPRVRASLDRTPGSEAADQRLHAADRADRAEAATTASPGPDEGVRATPLPDGAPAPRPH